MVHGLIFIETVRGPLLMYEHYSTKKVCERSSLMILRA